MLTDEQLAEALDLIDSRYQKIVREYLQKVGRTVLQIGKLNRSSVNLLIQLRRMGVDLRTIEQELQKATRLTKRDIRVLFQKAAEEEHTDAEFEYVSKGVEPSAVRWEALVEDLWRQTAGSLDNLSGTTVLNAGYRQMVDEAVQAVTMGATDYNSAIRGQLRKAGRAGIQVQYASGARRRLDSAIRQNVLDGVRQVQQQAQALIGEEIGADGVDISAHPNSAPDHEPVQGRRFDLENFRAMQAGRDFRDVDGRQYQGFDRPITQWRCRHVVHYILLGISRRLYTKEQLDRWQRENRKGVRFAGRTMTRYEATQLMRRLETEIRREKDTGILAQAAGDQVLRRECQGNITRLTREYQALAEAAKLKTRFEKTRVEGFIPVEMEE